MFIFELIISVMDHISRFFLHSVSQKIKKNDSEKYFFDFFSFIQAVEKLDYLAQRFY